MPTLLFSPGPAELVIILLIVVVIFGARRLPAIGEGIGKAISGLKRGLNANDDIDVTADPKQMGEGSEESVSKSVSEAEVVDK